MTEEKNNNPLRGLLSENDESGGNSPWSLEKTQQRLLTYTKLYISKYAPADTAALKRITINTAKLLDSSISEKDILKELKKEEKILTKSVDGILKKVSKTVQKNKKVDITRKKAKDILSGKSRDKMENWISGLTSGFSKLGGTVEELTAGLAIEIPVIGIAVAAFIAIVEKNVTTWQSLSNVGQTFGNDMFKMSAALYNSGLGFDNATKFLINYSHIVATVGSQAMLDLQKEVRITTNKFANYGLTVDQVADVTGSLMEQQINRGQFSLLNDGKQAKRTAEYMKTLKILAVLTGRQVDELDKEQRARSTNVNEEQAYQRILHTKGKKAADEFRAKAQQVMATAQFLGPDAAKLIMTAFYNNASGLSIAMDDNAKLIQASGLNITKLMSDLSNASTPEEMKKAELNLISKFLKLGDKTGGLVGILGISGGSLKGNADELTKIMIYMRKLQLAIKKNGGNVSEAMASVAKNIEKSTPTTQMIAQQNKLRTQMGKLSGSFQQLLSNAVPTLVLVMNILTKAFKGVNWVISLITKSLTFLENRFNSILSFFGVSDKQIKEIDKEIKSILSPFVFGFGIMSIAMLSVVKPVKLVANIFKWLAKLGGKFIGLFGGKAAEKVVEETGIKAAEKVGGKAAGKVGGKVVEETGIKAAEKVGTKLAEKTLIKTGSKFIGKSLIKKIPLVGALAGLAFGADRLFNDGDVIGALGEVTSGFLSIIPGLGTAASIAVDAALAARDIARATGPQVKQEIRSSEKKQVTSDINLKKIRDSQISAFTQSRYEFNNNNGNNADNSKNMSYDFKSSYDMLSKINDSLNTSNTLLLHNAKHTEQISKSAKRSEPSILHNNGNI